MQRKKLPDKEDNQLLCLQTAIREFKRYDEERKRYLQKLQDELEDYSEKYCMLKEALSENEKEILKKYEDKILAQRTHIKSLQNHILAYKKIAFSKGYDEGTLQRLEHIIEHCSKIKLKEENDQLKKDVERYRRDSHDTVAKIVALQKQLKNNNLTDNKCGNS